MCTPPELFLTPSTLHSNEPGYYEDGNFGVRVENLVVVKEVETPNRCEKSLWELNQAPRGLG